MEFRPILSAMRRNKFGAILIAVQMAVTLAFLANSLSLIEQRLSYTDRPTGVDDADLFVILSEPVERSKDAAAREQADLAKLRSLDGVVDAYVTNDYPLAGGGWSLSARLTPDQNVPTALSAYYFGDEHALGTLGLKLIAGRNFTADEIATRTPTEVGSIDGIIVTKALADKVFPNGDALGKSLYVESDTRSVRIIGIVERLQTPFYGVTGVASTYAENSTIAPYRPVDNYPTYMIRARPGQRNAVMKAAENGLLQLDGERILRTKSMTEVRAEAYRGDHGLIVLLVAVCTALLLITAFGIVGLTSYWVSQRRRQIGIRRALGATRRAILHYFQTENLLIAAAGAAAGAALAIGLNLWMVRSFEVVRMDSSRAFIGALIMLGLGQLAVLYPALRAASIPPALATRGG
jgi:putative ABC transport system permease protein